MPIGILLVVKAQVKEIKSGKVIAAATVLAKNEVCARGELAAVQMTEKMKPTSSTT